jgi:hypothetical protein
MNADQMVEAYKEGVLYKPRKILKSMKQNYFLLRGYFLYHFRNRQDVEPKHVIFLQGCSVEAEVDSEYEGFYGIRIVSPSSHVRTGKQMQKNEKNHQKNTNEELSLPFASEQL